MSKQENSKREEHFDAIIIGAGPAGLYQLHKLLKLGISVALLEAGSGVGGVWYWNRYPGARLDSESYTYGYFFSDEITNGWNWSEEFVGQPELERYYNFVVDKLDLRSHIQFNTRLDAAHFDVAAREWHLDLSGGRKMSCKFLLPALGILSAPIYPNIPGRDVYSGTMLLTALWPKEKVDLAGKRVAVVGTGASGVQLVSEIAGVVSKLYVFQRTPNWCLPLNNKPISDERSRELRANARTIYERLIAAPNGYIHAEPQMNGADLTAQERRSFYDNLWRQSGLRFFSGNFKDMITDRTVNDSVNEYLAETIRGRIKDPKLAEKLVPRDHGFGTKRPPLEKGYYEAFNQDNVVLVDMREEPIREFSKNGIVTTKEEYPCDVIVIATGFDALTGALERVDIRGVEGKNLKEHWAKGARTHISMFSKGFPNLFMVNGPQGPTGNNTRTSEYIVDFVTSCIEYMQSNGYAVAETTSEAEEHWVQKISDAAKKTLIDGEQTTWLLGTNVEGKVRAPLQFLEGLRAFRKYCSELREQNYKGITFSK